jgi:adenylosuccinate lyase
MADNEAGLKAQIAEMQQKLDQLKATATSSNYDAYQTSLTGRYCSPEMSKLFSQRSRHSTWRKLWLYLAESEHEIGIETITPEALEQMRAHLELTDADFEVARVEEKKRRHDVMAHVHAFGAVAPAAAGIIHYGVSIRDPISAPLSWWNIAFHPFVTASYLHSLLTLIFNRQPAATSLTTRS